MSLATDSKADRANRSVGVGSRPCCTGLKACPAWPGEPWLKVGNASQGQRVTARALAAHWLLPFKEHGITREALEPHARHREAEDVLCPVLQVVSNRIFVVGSPRMRQLDMQLHRCDAEEIPGDTNLNFCRVSGAACKRLARVWERHRFQVVLRLLRMATARARLPDFELRVCLDDTCHGVWEQPPRPRPIFTMATCLSSPTLPMVQWNSFDARDPDLSVWDHVWKQWANEAKQSLTPSRWAAKRSLAVFRGAANQLHTYNNDWSTTRRLSRSRITAANFNVSGRWALTTQKLSHPELLNVRLTVLRRAGTIFGEKRDPDTFRRRMAAVTSDGPAQAALEVQAALFKYLIHVEGHGGWADRLKRQLFQGATTIKQSSGVVEWFEPELVAGRHFFSVSGDLANLSDAIRLAQRDDEESRRMAVRAVAKAEELLSLGMIVEYAVELFTQYAQLYRDPVVLHERARAFTCWPAVINASASTCAAHPLRTRQLTDCGFVARSSSGDSAVERHARARPSRAFSSLRAALGMNASSPRHSYRAVTRRTPCVVPGRLRLGKRPPM